MRRDEVKAESNTSHDDVKRWKFTSPNVRGAL